MKRKIFSKLLMVALVIAAVGSFVSCKDYDDDINNLQKQIDAKAAISQIESLQSQLTAAQSAATAAQQSATQALEEAKKKTTDEAVKKAIDEAIAKVNAAAEKAATETTAEIKKAADAAKAAGDDAAAAKTAADEAKTAAQKAYDDAIAAIKAEIAKINIPDVSGFLTKAQIEALISQNAQAKGEYVTAASLATQLDELKKTIHGAVDLTEINKAIESYSGAISELYSAVTSVELYGTISWGGTPTIARWLTAYSGIDIDMTHGLIKETSVFGDKEDGAHEASPLAHYTEGADVKDPHSLLVRVNPVNANLASAKIILINSKGESLENFVKVGTPTKYNKLITRAVSTGLWELPLTVAEGVKKADFNKAITDATTGNKVLYAVAINNTLAKEDNADRFVASTYDVAVTYNDYVPANHFTFTVKNSVATTSVEGIHNRWDRANDQIVGENGTDKITTNPEMAWITPTTTISAPVAVPVYTPAAKANVQKESVASARWTLPATVGFTEDRVSKPLFVVSEDKPFTITGLAAYTANGTKVSADSFYVALDYKNAIESAPSEINAWNSYQYEGLNTMVAATEDLSITVKSGYNANGDVIGFRVWAVNRDGSLVDPDGRAFYVLVTTNATDNALAATVTATKAGSTDVSTNMDITGKFQTGLTYKIQVAKSPKVITSATTSANASLNYFKFNFKKGSTTTSYNPTGAAETEWQFPTTFDPTSTGLTITPKNIENLIDDATYVFTLTGYQTVGTAPNITLVPRTVTTITLQKLMPTTAKTLEFRPKQEVTDGSGKFIAYMIPNKGNAWATPWATTFATDDNTVYNTTAGAYADNGFKNLNNVFYNLNNDATFEFVFKNSLRKSATEIVDLKNANGGIIYDTPGTGVDPNHYMLDVATEFIDGATEHAVEVSTVYPGISSKLKADGSVDKFRANYPVQNTQNLTAIYACWHHASTFAWRWVPKAGTVPAHSSQPRIKWTHEGTTKTSPFTDIVSTNSYDNPWFGKDLKTLMTNTWLINPTGVELNTKADGTGQKNPYFVPTITTGTATITYTQVNTQTDSAPVAEHTEYIIFKMKDAYGHDVVISLPVTILDPNTAE